jgi:peptidoglycan/xylan/chitin deacetylase (PgdA/CDA1 family)
MTDRAGQIRIEEDSMTPARDLIGYAGRPPHPRWPGGARVAVQFVLNIEAGAESCILNGDARSEAYLHELPGRPAREGERDLSVEGLYEYGARAGFWRLLDLFAVRGLHLTAFAVGMALEMNPSIAQALAAAGHEVAGHGYRWLDYRGVPEEEERRHIHQTVAVITRLCGRRPLGWYTGRVSANTRRLVREEGGFLYSSDAYNDDLPYWLPDTTPDEPMSESPDEPRSTPPATAPNMAPNMAQGIPPGTPPHLIIPYTLVNNDAQYLMPHGFATGADFFHQLRDAFDQLWLEGASSPKLMSIGLHPRISGHPARARALARFLDYLLDQDGVWVCRREEIARHWLATHPA